MKKILIFILIFSFSTLALPSKILAQEEAISTVEAGITPESPLYFLDIWIENIQIFFTFNKGKKVEKRLEFADQRLAELEEIADTATEEQLEKLGRDYEKQLEKIEEKELSEDMKERIREARERHIRILENVLNEAPEDAKPALESVIENAKERFNQIVSYQERLDDDDRDYDDDYWDEEDMPYLGDEYDCNETLDSVIVEDLIVPINTTCTLNNTKVRGDISVYEGATLYTNATRVKGDLEAEYAEYVEINPESYIGGNVEFEEGVSLYIDSVMIKGGLEVEESTGDITVNNSTIEGDAEFEENMGGLTIMNNSIYGDFECEENYPEPTYSGNSVRGDYGGQCYMDEMENDDDDDKDYDDDDEEDMSYLGDEYDCNETLDSVIVEDLSVPANASCTLNNAKIRGDVTVYKGATLYANATRVEGDLEAESAEYVEINPESYIGGSVEFEEGFSLYIDSVMIKGGLQVEESNGEITIKNSTIEGDAEFEENMGGLTIMNNSIYGDLECEENSPAPDYSGNSVRDDRAGQCYMDGMENDDEDMDDDDDDDDMEDDD